MRDLPAPPCRRYVDAPVSRQHVPKLQFSTRTWSGGTLDYYIRTQFMQHVYAPKPETPILHQQQGLTPSAVSTYVPRLQAYVWAAVLVLYGIRYRIYVLCLGSLSSLICAAQTEEHTLP